MGEGTVYRRKAYDRLKQWKDESGGRTSLLITGARRVGKSSLATEFGREYRRCLLVDFSTAPSEVLDLFREQRHDVDTLLRYLFAYYGFTPVERDTLIIFDEVQLCPQARAATKQLVADGRYDYLSTGSLISIRENVKDILIPSEERSLDLQPFDFQEFLWAMGEEPLEGLIRQSYAELTPLPEGLHRKAERLFREYMLVGGMPQSIQSYRDHNSFQAADETKRDILDLYRNDIARYGGMESARVAAIFDAIPAQLSKHEKKFRMTALGKNARRRNYESAFFWLADAGMTNMCFNATDPSVGLGLNMEQSSFKCYMADTGLLVSLALANNTVTTDDVYRDVLFGKIGLNEGMLVENVVAQQFRAAGHKLFFFSKTNDDTRRGRMEIDFLLSLPYRNAAGRHRISPVEVKSTKRYGTASLDKMRATYGKHIGTEYMLHPKPLTIQEDRQYLPLYMAGLL